MTLQEQYFEKTLKAATTMLGRWKGARAVMWELTATLKTLRILLTHGDGNDNLLLSCIDPVALKGPVRWEQSDLRVSRVQLGGGDEGFRVVDEKADIEVTCGAVEIKENVKIF
jgi:hypothetical protein